MQIKKRNILGKNVDKEMKYLRKNVDKERKYLRKNVDKERKVKESVRVRIRHKQVRG